MQSDVDSSAVLRGSFNASQRQVDKPPILDDGEEEILDRIWARIEQEEEKKHRAI